MSTLTHLNLWWRNREQNDNVPNDRYIKELFMKLSSPRHIYHIFPLGALRQTSGYEYAYLSETRFDNIRKLETLLPRLKELCIDTLLLGPVFHSEHHGYEPVDNFRLDPRLGNNEDLEAMIHFFHQNNIKVWLDAVWNHTGQRHRAFQDIEKSGSASQYSSWYKEINWNKSDSCGHSFTISGWNGHLHLPELNLKNPDVIRETQDQLAYWIERFEIDGVRIDAADVMDLKFLKELSDFAHKQKPGFFLMGEVIHGNYQNWINSGGLDSVTHYEGYKSLWSSFNDRNFHEIAWSLNRLFNKESGIYNYFKPVLFNENHDVTRLASQLNNQQHLYPLHLFHYTLPGIPSVYYGEEYALESYKKESNDWNLRPPLSAITPDEKHPHLPKDIARLARFRQNHPALSEGNYTQLHVDNELLIFMREYEKECLIVAINGSHDSRYVEFEIPLADRTLHDCLNDKNYSRLVQKGKLSLEIPGNWGRVMSL